MSALATKPRLTISAVISECLNAEEDRMAAKFTALIDGDILLYRSAAACEHKKYTYTLDVSTAEEDFAIRTVQTSTVEEARKKLGADFSRASRTTQFFCDPVDDCIRNIRSTLRRIQKVTGADNLKIYLGGETNFRYGVDPDYKKGRAEKPKYYQVGRDYLIDYHNAEICVGEEADDKLGQMQNYNTVICSIDKDLYQIPGNHYNWVTDEWCFIDKPEADEWFWIQMLVGDRVDNIPGIPGVGLATAVKLLGLFDGDLEQMYGFVRGCYKEAFPDKAKQFMDNLRLLYIKRRSTDVTIPQIIRETTDKADEYNEDIPQ
jgi:5'-3' exonuclease